MGLLAAVLSIHITNNIVISKAGPRLAMARWTELKIGAKAKKIAAGRDGVALWELCDSCHTAGWLSATDIELNPLASSATIEGLLDAVIALPPLEAKYSSSEWTLESRCLSPHSSRPSWSGALPCALAQVLQPQFGRPALGSADDATALILIESAHGFWLASKIRKLQNHRPRDLFLQKWTERPFRIGSAATNPEVALIVASLALGLAKSSRPTIVDTCAGSGTLLATLAARLSDERKSSDGTQLIGFEQSAATAAGASENIAMILSGRESVAASVVCSDARMAWPLPAGCNRDLVVVGNLPWGHTVRDDGASYDIVRQAAFEGAHSAVFITSDVFELPDDSSWECVDIVPMTAGRSRGVRSAGPFGCSLVVLQRTIQGA